ncbi:SpoIID/LytB domain-containing protein [Acidobacteria bacterium AH-259-O06]|nr:SpoIID/LytB domain-containing protein [Acidobacteria bacterium AH-259-O06]
MKRFPKIKGSPRIRVLLKENFASARLEGAALAPLLLIVADRGKVRLGDRKGQRLRSGSGFRLEPSRGKLLKLDGVLYRGAVEVFINPLRRPVIVNELNLEDYLKGVVPSELSPVEFPQLEAIKAQTIAARTFALSNLGQNAVRGFDLYADNRAQVYGGARSEKPLSNRAVEETRGIIATYQDRPIVAFYSSTCGGLTEDYQVIFQRPRIPYLRGRAKCPDSSSPYSSWNDHIQISRIQRKLDRLAGVGRLKKLIPLRKSRAGRIVEMRFVGSKGEKVLAGLDIRSALGLRSNWVTALDPRYDDSGYMVEIRVQGRGLGHGVGLCQIGTVELAKRGWSFERILKHYYHGIDLKRYW